MIYGRGKVWVICSEQYSPKFLMLDLDAFKVRWTQDISQSRFYNKEKVARGVLANLKKRYKAFGLREEEVQYTSVIELELVQHVPDDFGQ